MEPKKIAIIGHGRIGQTIKKYLEDRGHEVSAFDAKSQPGVTLIPDDADYTDFKKLLERYDGVVAATPYHMNLRIAEAAISTGTAYFDLTEDVQVADSIRESARLGPSSSAKNNFVWVAPQCGLAPGAVSMIANHLTTKLDDVLNVEIRVGALPMSANNRMKYYLTWSSEGLVNEYCNPCQALINGIDSTVQPLEGYEQVVINGDEYEAFNTSGGIGTLIQTLPTNHPSIHNVNYKTLRYKGHRDLIHFTLHDLGFGENKEALVELFNQEVPHVTNDVVVIFIQVTGYHNGELKAETYCRKLYGDGDVTAIQLTTACGICAVIEYWATHDWSDTTTPYIITPESIPHEDLVDNPFWHIYKND